MLSNGRSKKTENINTRETDIEVDLVYILCVRSPRTKEDNNFTIREKI